MHKMVLNDTCHIFCSYGDILWNIAEIARWRYHLTLRHLGIPRWWRSLQWRHNEPDGVSNHQPHDCLLNCLFRRRSKKTSKLRVIGLCAVTGEFPAQKASNAEDVSISMTSSCSTKYDQTYCPSQPNLLIWIHFLLRKQFTCNTVILLMTVI